MNFCERKIWFGKNAALLHTHMARTDKIRLLDVANKFVQRNENRFRNFVKVPMSSKFLFSYLILYLTQWTSAKEKFGLDKMQPFLEVLKTFKFAAI